MMKIFVFGKTEVRIYGGYKSVGGNCVVVKSPSLNLMFDQGINFAQLKKFYGFSIQPDSVEELREMEVLPPREAYEIIDGVYVSHLHLDHLGSLNVPRNLPVYLPSRELSETLSRTWWFNWKQHLFPQTLSLTGFPTIEEGGKISFVKVSHSAYPSYAFRADTDDVSIVYTGDFRVSSPYPNIVNTLEGLGKLFEEKVDVLIIEGTNFGRRMNYVSASQFKTLFNEVLKKYTHSVLFISIHPLDLEATLAILELLWKHEFTPVFVNAYYAKLLDIQLNDVGYETENDLLFTPLKVSKVQVLNNFETTYLSDLRDKRIAVFIQPFGIKDLKNIINLLGTESSGLIHIMVFGEPLDEEWVIEEKRIANWLSLLGITSLRIHLSGHYHPYEFKEILEITRPKTLIPIHTKTPDTLVTLFNKM